VLDRLGPKEIIARELATGVPMIYRLNADATVAERQDVAA
jgi:2,3-bisphosphoglycerate-dependent phosphoglycerate mutase